MHVRGQNDSSLPFGRLPGPACCFPGTGRDRMATVRVPASVTRRSVPVRGGTVGRVLCEQAPHRRQQLRHIDGLA
jgi:hypothetical protein